MIVDYIEGVPGAQAGVIMPCIVNLGLAAGIRCSKTECGRAHCWWH